MKKLLKLILILQFIGIIASGSCMYYFDAYFSMYFKLLLFFLSGFIGTLAILNSNLSKVVIALAIISITLLAISLLKTDLFEQTWNYTLAIHVLLLGCYFYFEIKKIPAQIIRVCLNVILFFSLLLFCIFAIFKYQSETSMLMLFIPFAILTVTMTCSNIYFLIKK